jgi:putative tryptophan/tyrosine transport system substrate-binding protein
MRRRGFLGFISMTIASWPLVAFSQQPTRGIALLINAAEDDALGQAGVMAFQNAMKQLGWTEGQNLRIDVRWSANDVERDRRYAAELLALRPDVILAAGTLSVSAVHRLTRTLPIVFVRVTDPVGAGFVTSLARPSGNVTGFMLFEYSLSGKWLELLKEIAPHVTRVAVLRDAANPAAIAQYSVIQAASHSFRMQVTPIGMESSEAVESSLVAFARIPNGGLIIAPSAGVSAYRDAIIAFANRHKLPAVYGEPTNAVGGGLVSYGPDRVHQFQLAAGYVDRILKGEKPGDLPVQAPTKYELVINLKTAKALGLTGTSNAARPRRRGNRIRLLFCCGANVGCWHIADIRNGYFDVRLRWQSRHPRATDTAHGNLSRCRPGAAPPPAHSFAGVKLAVIMGHLTARKLLTH